MASADFGELLQAAEQLTAEFDPSTMTSDLPRVERNLHQLVEVGQQLFAKTARDAGGLGTQDVKASILLGSRGVDLPSISQKLESLSSMSAMATGFEPVEPLRDTDVAGFLKNERENAILAIIEETRKETFESVEKSSWDASSAEWESEKRRFLTAIGDTGGSDLSQSFLLRPEQSHIHDSTLGTRSALDALEMIYADQVCSYNEAVSKGGPKPNLFEKFSSLFSEDRDPESALLWEIVCNVSKNLQTRGSDQVKVRTSAVTSKAIVANAKTYLEQAFGKFARNTVFSNLHQAQLGGIPGTFNLVKSFINVRGVVDGPAFEDGLLEGVPVWPIIFYCIRCGDLKAAILAANKAGPGLSEIGQLLTEMSSSSDGRLSAHTENVVRISYRRSIRSTSDPYKRAVYCVVAACDPNDEHREVATSADDYLWIKLSQIRDEEVGVGGELLTLAQLQHLMSEEYGESHFNAFEQPVLYSQVLFLTGQFESAVEFLFRCERFRAHGVHIALALFESGLLLLPANTQSTLLSIAGSSGVPATVKKLNIARLVLLYVRKFESTDPKEALHYFYFLRNLSGQNSSNLFASCVSELVLESRQFDLLLGHIQPDGIRTPGLVDRFNGQGVEAQQIIEMVAADSEDKGMFEDSVKLYDLAANHEKVVELLSKLLAQVVAQASVSESRRDRLHRLAVTIAKRYKTDGHSASQETTATFFLLLDMMTFFDLFHVKKYEEALDIIMKIKVVPFSQSDVDLMVSTFRALTDEVRRNIPDVLLASMTILVTQYKTAKAGTPVRGSNDGGRQKHLDTLRERAKSLITFAGMIPYRMPGDINARLVHMEVLMN